MQNTNTIAAGIDTAKKTLDLPITGQTQQLHVANTEAGWRQIAAAVARRCRLRITGILPLWRCARA